MSFSSAYFTVGSGGQRFLIQEPPGTIVLLNRMEMRTGARPGKGVFVMVRSDYDALVAAASKAAQATLTMQGSPGPGVSLPVIVAGAEPIVTTPGTTTSNEMVKVTVYDTRVRNYNPIKRFYNVMQDGFPQSGGSTQCYTSTLNSSSPWTWKQILTDSTVVASAGIPSDLPAWTPYNLVFDNVSAASVLDDIASRLFYVVAFDHQNATAGNGYGLSLLAPGAALSANGSLVQQASASLDAGDVATRNSSRLPGQIIVCFQGYNADDPTTDPYSPAHRSYEKAVSSGENTSTDFRIPLHVGEQIAIWSGGTLANQSTLDAIAADMAARCDAWISQDFGQQEFIGIWPFRPDGNWRAVTWVSDRAGARTILGTDNRKDWFPGDSVRDPINQATNQEVIGLGATGTTIGAGGTKYVWLANALTRPQYQHQVYQGVAQNEPGWDYIKAYSLS